MDEWMKKSMMEKKKNTRYIDIYIVYFKIIMLSKDINFRKDKKKRRKK